MDALLAAVASDLVGRLISFLSSKCQEHRAGDDGASRLQRALLRARVVMEEAEGRQVTSPAMLRQLRRLRWEMCRAAYALDALRIRTAAAVVVAAAGASRCCSAWAVTATSPRSGRAWRPRWAAPRSSSCSWAAALA
ncbi:hypothetical protein OsI_01234 [Oryza sativa Indica Group]|uniref:Disease resistance N-terminal domain-containing protein n=1 Tax=Oryza sativa subsp. indica TaxID=39946 RepID=B8ABU2_ORYSI|nr:hypothetical protein OsI_01234 [Oryza sativa Indica Group]